MCTKILKVHMNEWHNSIKTERYNNQKTDNDYVIHYFRQQMGRYNSALSNLPNKFLTSHILGLLYQVQANPSVLL
jgi:hypothetical protein